MFLSWSWSSQPLSWRPQRGDRAFLCTQMETYSHQSCRQRRICQVCSHLREQFQLRLTSLNQIWIHHSSWNLLYFFWSESSGQVYQIPAGRAQRVRYSWEQCFSPGQNLSKFLNHSWSCFWGRTPETPQPEAEVDRNLGLGQHSPPSSLSSNQWPDPSAS